MIGIDSNVLVYAFKSQEPNHQVARETLETILNQKEQVAFTDIVMFEFIAQASLKLGFEPSPSPAQAIAQLDSWLSAENATVIRNSPDNFATFARLCAETGRTGQQIYDAQIAAICIDNGVTEFITNDSRFEQFTELRVRNPFAK